MGGGRVNAGKVQLQARVLREVSDSVDLDLQVYRISDFPEYTGFMDKTGDR